MHRWIKGLGGLALGLVAAIGVVAAQPVERVKAGTVEIEQVQVAFVGSGNVGGGILSFQGKSYRLLRGGPPLGPHEYSRSGDMFESFFVNRAPFNIEFNAAAAHDFYEGVRCGRLHEARTKNG